MANVKMDDIRKMFAERLNVPEVPAEKSLKELGLDSLDVVEMCLELEDRYGIQFESDELSGFATVGDLYSSIEKKLAELK